MSDCSWSEAVYELCCWPDLALSVSPKIPDRPLSDISALPCPLQIRNLTKCCHQGFKTHEPPSTASAVVRNAFQGCSSPFWSAFLWKVRMSAGGIIGLCDSISATRTSECLFSTRRGEATKWLLGRPSFRSCALGQALLLALDPNLSMFEVSVAIDFLEVVAKELQLPEAASSIAAPWPCRGKPGFFCAAGVGIAQLRYLSFLQRVHHSGSVALSAELQGATPGIDLAVTILSKQGQVPLVLDFGASGGVDTEFYLATRHRVFSVEANPEFAKAISKRLGPFVKTGLLHVYNAAVGGMTAAEMVKLRIGFQPELAGLGPNFRRLGDVTRVPLRSCGELYLAALHWAGGLLSAELVKIDVEGEDLRCLRSLLYNSSRGNAVASGGSPSVPLAPRFISLEVQAQPLSPLSEFYVRELRRLLVGWYCSAKLCRQYFFNMRPQSEQVGLGASGPYGDAAVDWRSGELWRPLEDVLDELERAFTLARQAPSEWFDLHLRRCESPTLKLTAI